MNTSQIIKLVGYNTDPYLLKDYCVANISWGYIYRVTIMIKKVQNWIQGRVIAQAVSRRLPTTAVRGSKPDIGMWNFVMDKSGAGAGFLRELRFPLPIYIPSALHNHLHYHPRLAQ
jgi:hypothetical protein